MIKRLIIIMSIITSIGISTYLIRIYTQDFTLEQRQQYDLTMSVWVYSPILVDVVKEFEEKHSNIRINIRQFPNEKSLIEELQVVLSTDEGPDIAEVWSHYGIELLNESEYIVPIDHFKQAWQNDFHSAMLESFTYQDQLMAWPIGMEVPVLYYNHNLAEQITGPFLSLNSNNTIKYFNTIKQSIEENEQLNDTWVFHTDSNIPWYWWSWELDSNLSAYDWWESLVDEYQIMPPLDHHMAITHFANGNVAYLLSSSRYVSTFQQLIRNSFELGVLLFTPDRGSSILVKGNALVVLTEEREKHDALESFLQFIVSEEIQLLIAQNTGWLPPLEELLNNYDFIRQLPLSQHYESIIMHHSLFIGKEPDIVNQEVWNRIIEEAMEIEENALLR